MGDPARGGAVGCVGWIGWTGDRGQAARPGGCFFEHRPGRVGRTGGGAPIRPLAGEQLVQQDAERVDVGGGADALAAHLLRAGVAGGEWALAARGDVRRQSTVVRIQRLGDTEVQQLDLALCRDQHVAGLQVAVHQQHAVRIGHGVGQLEKDAKPLRQRQPATGVVDRPTLDQFHHEIGQAIGRQTGVEQPRDVRVVERGQRLLLDRKALQHPDAVHAALEDLDGRAARVGAVCAVGSVDLTHATAAQQAVELPGAQPLAVAHGLVQRQRGGQVEKACRRAAHVGAVLQQRQHFGTDRVALPGGAHKSLALIGGAHKSLALIARQINRKLEQGPRAGPVSGGQGRDRWRFGYPGHGRHLVRRRAAAAGQRPLQPQTP